MTTVGPRRGALRGHGYDIRPALPGPNLLPQYVTDRDNMYGMHLWAHLLWECERTNSPNTHGGVITAEWIRTIDTTHGVNVRQFLP